MTAKVQANEGELHDVLKKRYEKCGVFIIWNNNDETSNRFLSSKLEPLLETYRYPFMTTRDFVPSLYHEDNFRHLLELSIIVIIVMSDGLLSDPTVKDYVAKAVTYNRVNSAEKIIPIRLGKCNQIESECGLYAVSGIVYDESQPDCEETLRNGLKKAYELHEDLKLQRKCSGNDSTSVSRDESTDGDTGSTIHEEVSTSIADQKKDSSNACAPTNSHELRIFDPFRRPEYLHESAHVLKYIGIAAALLYFLMSLALFLLHNPDNESAQNLSVLKMLSRLLWGCCLIIFPHLLCSDLCRLAREVEDETLLLCQAAVKQIGNFLVGETQLKCTVNDPNEIFTKLKEFLQSVARIYLITAWLHPVFTAVILWMMGHFDVDIYNDLDYYCKTVYIATDVVAFVLVHGCIRTLIGILQYKRNLIVDTHRMIDGTQPTPSSPHIDKAAKMLRKKYDKRANNDKITVTAFAIPMALFAIVNAIFSNDVCKSWPGISYGFPILWLLLSEALVYCPKRHMKIAGTVLAGMAIPIAYFGGNVNKYSHLVEPLRCFLDGVTLRMFCLVATFHCLQHRLTVLRIANWPLQDVNIKDMQLEGGHWRTTLTMIALFVCSLLPGQYINA